MSDTPTVRWKNTPFAMVPRWIVRHADLSSRAVHLFAALATYTESQQDEAFPSRASLGKILNCGETSVANAKRELMSAGALECKERPGTSNIYLLIGEEPRQRADAPPSAGRQGPRQRADAEVEGLEVEPPTPIRAPAARTVADVVAASFSQWYEAYPRKVARRRAQTAYAVALRDGADPTVLLDAASRLATREVNKKFIPHPTTWLNQGRWDDDLDEAYPPEKLLKGSANNADSIAAGLARATS